MLVLKEEPWKCSVLQMESSKVVYWPHALRGFARHRKWHLYCIQSKESADLFKVAYFRPKTKTTQILVGELLFADDSMLVVHFAEDNIFVDGNKLKSVPEFAYLGSTI
jgi:hypothetical protein